ncbi:hypothetical protein HK102_007908 [Quaeritorhiza haematococci]|nr:hypothetical protein HK102_007908 [Quaeritorhiza haematococci]
MEPENTSDSVDKNTAASPSIPRSTGTPITPSKTLDTASPRTSSPASVSKAVQNFIDQSDEDWENKTLEYIFKSTLDSAVASQKQYTHLQTLAEELESESTPLKQRGSMLERIIYARLSMPENANTSPITPPLFDYLVGCWKRVGEIRRHVNGLVERGGNGPAKEVAKSRLGVLESVRTLVVSYSGLVVMPGMSDSFPQPEKITAMGPGYVAEKLLQKNPEDVERDIPREFLDDFVKRFEEDGLEDLFGPILTSVSAEMRTQSIVKDYQTPLRVISLLTSYKPVAAMMSTLSNWNPPNTTARTFEIITLLGPFFGRPSAFPTSDPDIGKTYFASSNPFGGAGLGHSGPDIDGFSIGDRNPGDVRASTTTLRGVVANVQTGLYNMSMSIIKASPAAREGVLDYIATAIAKNLARGKMHVERQEVSTDGFMYNILGVCLKLADPIMDPRYSKLHLIDPHYFKHPKSRLDISELTRINADKETADEYFKSFLAAQQQNPGAWLSTSPNFVSDVFYLTLAAHHYGLLSTIRYYQQFVRGVEDFREQVEAMRNERDRGAWQGPLAAVNEQMFKRYQTQLDASIAAKLAMDVVLLDKESMIHSLRFYNLAVMWLIRTVMVGAGVIEHSPAKKTGDGIPWDRLARGEAEGLPLFPLPEEVSKLFATIPEWIVEDICEYYLFVCRYKLTIFENQPRDEIVAFSMLMLANSHYVKNPYLKSKLVEILFYFTLPMYRTHSGEAIGRLDGVFSTHPMCREHLVRSLMKFYVDVEQTGMSSQFYDKFNIRYNISQILKKIWPEIGHRQKIIVESKRTNSFVKFVNLLMNDTTYLLDESLSKLTEIRNIENEMADAATYNAKPQQYRREREGTLHQSERQAQSYMSLGNETVHMLHYLTAEPQIVQPFMEPYIVERLAAMLDYNLAALVGPRCTELKVKNPEKYRFNPKKLLKELVEIYLHLAHRKEFVSAVAKDARSYRKEHFTKAAQIMMKTALMNQDEINRIHKFVEDVEETVRSEAVQEEELGEIPDEFLDPLMYTMPLTLDMIIPNTELKQKIQEWKASAKKGGGGGQEKVDAMEM